MISLSIDGNPVTATEGSSVLDAARSAGIAIPTLCYHPKLSAFGGCRLCIVQIEGIPRPVTSCTTPAAEGMVVTTASPEITALRKTVLELILSDHPNDCMVCEGAGCCDLQELAYEFGIRDNPYSGERRQYETRDANPFIERDMEKCIACGRCVKVCDEIQGVGAINFTYRGFKTKICPPFERELDCEFCGQCIQVCPTGALTGKQWARTARTLAVKEVKTVCGYCGVGCELMLHVQNNRIIRVSASDSAWNEGWLCVKGRFGYSFADSPDRLTTPLIRKDDILKPATWDEALSLVAKKLSAIKTEHGPDAIGGFSSARCTNEENYAFQKLIRAAIGSNNVDHCARLCHAPTVSGLAAIFGSGAMTNSIAEIEDMDVLFLIGTNTKESHPVIANRMLKAKRRGAKIILADPRRVPMARFADIRLHQKPGTDIALLNGIAHIILKEDLYNADFIRDHADGFEQWKSSVAEFTPEAVEKITGVPADALTLAARLYGASRKAGIFYTMGITQHSTGTYNVRAIANLVLLTGNIGRPSTGINPLRGQNNVQGASDAAALPNVLPGYQLVTSPEARAKFESVWGVTLPAHVGMTVTEMIPAAYDGHLKALYIMGENPVISDPDTNHTVAALKKLDFLVVQDIFLTETAQLADVVLPAACFAEKDGTFTNTERKVQRLRKAVNPPGEAKDDLSIINDLSARLGYSLGCETPEVALAEYASLWPSIAGISYERLKHGGIAWPCPSADHPGTPYLYANGFPKGKAPFSSVPFAPPVELTDTDYPFILTTGRNLYQYHTGTMTRRVKPIELHAGSPYIEINPADAARLGIADKDSVAVTSRRGSITLQTRITRGIDEGVVFIPMHYHEAAANVLTNAALDPVAKIPEFKACAVSIKNSEVSTQNTE